MFIKKKLRYYLIGQLKHQNLLHLKDKNKKII